MGEGWKEGAKNLLHKTCPPPQAETSEPRLKGPRWLGQNTSREFPCSPHFLQGRMELGPDLPATGIPHGAPLDWA